MEWRGQAASSVSRGFNWPVAVCLILVLGGGALVHTNRRNLAGILFAIVAAYVVWCMITAHRNKRRGE